MINPTSLDEKQGFPHFMLKEIFEQPEVLQSGLETWLNSAASHCFPVQLNLPQSFYTGWQQLQIIACGTSLHAGLIAQHWFEQMTGIPTLVRSASALVDAPLPLVASTLTIAITQSGETADVLSALHLEHHRSSTLPKQFLGITNRPASSLRSQVSHLLPTLAGTEVAIAATKTFTAQLLVLCCVMLDIAYRRQILPPPRFAACLTGLRQLPAQIETILSQQEQIHRLAQELAPMQNCVLLGRGIHFPIALEGALKLKETCYIHAEGYLMGEFLHGPVAMLDEKIPVIAIVAPGVPFDRAIANLQKIKARGSRLIGITSPGAADMAVFDEILALPEVDEMLSPFLSVIPLQLLAYAIAVQRGLDVDHPRNLEKSLGNQ